MAAPVNIFGEAASFSPLKVLKSPFDELLYTAFDSYNYQGISYAIYFGTTGVTPTYKYFTKGCILIQATDATIYINTGDSLDTPVWQLLGTSTPAALADGSIFIGNTSNVPAAHALSGDVTITNTGVATVDAVDLETAAVTGIADTEILIGTGAATAAFAALSGDATMTNAGVVSVSDLTIASEAAGDILYFNGTNWVRLAIGTAGQTLKVNAGATAPEWVT